MTPELYHILLKNVILFSRPAGSSLKRLSKALKTCAIHLLPFTRITADFPRIPSSVTGERYKLVITLEPL